MSNFEEKPTQEVASFYQELLLKKYAPTCILINENEKVLQINGDLEKYFTRASNAPGQLLSAYVDKVVYSELMKGIREVAEGEDVVMIDGNVLNALAFFKIYILSMIVEPSGERLFLIEFEDTEIQNTKKIINNPSVVIHDFQEQLDNFYQVIEHDIKNAFSNFVMLTNLEETSYSKADKIQDIKGMQEKILSNMHNHLNRLINFISIYFSNTK